jgi:hypothetical protein
MTGWMNDGQVCLPAYSVDEEFEMSTKNWLLYCDIGIAILANGAVDVTQCANRNAAASPSLDTSRKPRAVSTPSSQWRFYKDAGAGVGAGAGTKATSTSPLSSSIPFTPTIQTRPTSKPPFTSFSSLETNSPTIPALPFSQPCLLCSPLFTRPMRVATLPTCVPVVESGFPGPGHRAQAPLHAHAYVYV